MKKLLKDWLDCDRRIESVVSGHYGCPTGVIGRVAGERMVRQHELETSWTVSLLALAPTDRVLEIGCGAGRALELAAREISGGQVVGIDLSAVMVRAARRRNARAIKARHVVVEHGDVMNLPFPDHHFDKLFSIHSVYFWPDRVGSLAELRRVLKPGGVMALTLTTGKVEAAPPEPNWFQSLLEDHLLPEITQAGLQDVAIARGPESRGWKIAAASGVK